MLEWTIWERLIALLVAAYVLGTLQRMAMDPRVTRELTEQLLQIARDRAQSFEG